MNRSSFGDAMNALLSEIKQAEDVLNKNGTAFLNKVNN